MRLVIDSAFLIAHLRGLPAATDRLAQILEMGDDPIVTEVIVCEVRAGLRPENERDLAALLGPMEFVQPDPATAMRAGRWRAEARARAGR